MYYNNNFSDFCSLSRNDRNADQRELSHNCPVWTGKAYRNPKDATSVHQCTNDHKHSIEALQWQNCDTNASEMDINK